MPIPEHHLSLLLRRRVVLIRLGSGVWEAIEHGRDGGSRLSLVYQHEVARLAQPHGLALVAVDDEDEASDEPHPRLFVGLVTSIAGVAFFDSRVVVNHVGAVLPRTLPGLLSQIDPAALRAGVTRIAQGTQGLAALAPKLAAAMVRRLAAEPFNQPVLS